MTDINELTEELNNTKELTNFIDTTSLIPSSNIEPEVDINNVEEYVIKKTATIIEQGIDILDAARTTVAHGGTAEEIESYSKLFTSLTTAIEVLNKLSISNQKNKTAKELKNIDKSKQNNPSTQNNILITNTTREELMNMIFKNKQITTTKTKE